MPADTSVYRHKRSPYWQLNYYDPVTLRRRSVSTPFRLDDPNGHRRALALAAEKSRGAAHRKDIAKEERWDNWAPEFLADKFGAPEQANTLERYRRAWDVLREYLEEEDIFVPLALQHIHLVRFVKWRTQQTRNNGKHIAKNTALMELKCLRLVMQEAVRRSYCQGNPCLRHGISKLPAKQKPEMTDAEIAKIRELLRAKEGKLPLKDRWMTISFEIALSQGCRLSETSLPIDTHIELAKRTIRFEAKGRNGVKHIFTTRMHEALAPLIAALISEGATHTCHLPKRASLNWWEFFQENGLGHLCFHCTRVTVVTRLCRAGVPKAQAMRFVGHSSEIVHQIYERLSVPDLGLAAAALSGLGSAVSWGGGATEQTPGGGGATS